MTGLCTAVLLKVEDVSSSMFGSRYEFPYGIGIFELSRPRTNLGRISKNVQVRIINYKDKLRDWQTSQELAAGKLSLEIILVMMCRSLISFT